MHIKSSENWRKINSISEKELNAAIDQIHYAVQYVAMAGKHFIDNKPDDSHTTMVWHYEKRLLIGEPILKAKKPFRIALYPEQLTLYLLNEDLESINHLELSGKTLSEGADWLINQLNSLGLDGDTFNLDLHYEIPNHPIANGAQFNIENPIAFKTNADLRNNARIILNHIASLFPDCSDVRTWPHHFDNGAYIPLAKDEDGNDTRSIGIGMAIHDDYYDHHYFYINHWIASDRPDYSNLPTLSYNAFWNRNDWVGAILPTREVYQLPISSQLQTILDFYIEGINASLELIKLPQLKIG